MRTLYRFMAAGVALMIFGAGVLAYFVRSFNVEQQVVYDGLGRALSAPPDWARLFTEQLAWAGPGWFAIDFVVFFGGMFLAYRLYELGQNAPSRAVERSDEQLLIKAGKVEMLSEVADLMSSESYAAMNAAERKHAVSSIRKKHGFQDTTDRR